METWTDDDGQVYVSCDLLCVGDYGGAGSTGEANIRCLEDREDCVVQHGSHGFRQAWLLDTPENRGLVRELERDYPLLDEERASRIEDEWEREAWESWLRSDLYRTLSEETQEAADAYLDDDDLWTCYRAAMDEENERPIVETNSVYVRIHEIAETYNRLVAEAARVAQEERTALCAKLGLDPSVPDGILADAKLDAGL